MHVWMILGFIGLLTGTLALTCTEQWECSSVTTDFNYVGCVNNNCLCRTSLGFVGSATTTDKCRCEKKVFWENRIPYCTSLQDGVSWGTLKQKQNIWRENIRSVYNLTIWPYNENYINGAPLPDVLADDIDGIVHPFGYHHTKIGVAEYFYGLTPNNITFDTMPASIIVGVHMTQFIADIEQKKASTTINYQIALTSNPSVVISNATQTGFWRFDDQDKIVEYQLWNPLYSLSSRGGRFDANPQKTINDTCSRHERFCLGDNKQYESFDACVAFLSAKPFGQPDVFTADNVICRNQHATLIKLRPEVHCMHVGPTGGGFCQDWSLISFFRTPKFPATVTNRLLSPVTLF